MADGSVVENRLVCFRLPITDYRLTRLY